ncbi:hypothetical protein GCM10022248_68310 [Nonomuraea soli]
MPGDATRRYLAALRERGPLDVRWDRAPTRHKRYPEAARVTLPWRTTAEPSPEALAGALLRELLGFDRLVWLHQLDEEGAAAGGAPMLVLGRPAPSGGALYPIEAYVALAGGLYHYDPVHHVLELVRGGDHRPVSGLPEAGGVLVLTAVFWRSMFKYGDFGYRLMCQETGVLLAQAQAAGARLGIGVRAHLGLREADLECVLGLDGRREAVMAALSLTFPCNDGGPGEPVHGERARPSSPPPLPLVGGPAALLHRSTATTGEPGPLPEPWTLPEPPEPPLPLGARHQLPDATPVPQVRVSRTSPPAGYQPVPLPLADLAAILAAARAPHPGGLPEATVTIYLLALRVDGLPPAAYRYHPATTTLTSVGPPDPPPGPLHANTRAALRTAAAALIPVGDPLAAVEQVGDRWYRLQQIAAGASIHRAALAAFALGRAARIHSDGANDATDQVLGLAGTPFRSLSLLLLGTPLTRGPSLVRDLTSQGGDQPPARAPATNP